MAGKKHDPFSDDPINMSSLALNPSQRYYEQMKSVMQSAYEDNYWPEDAIFMERNSRDFESRISRINKNAEAICEVLLSSPIGQRLNAFDSRN